MTSVGHHAGAVRPDVDRQIVAFVGQHRAAKTFVVRRRPRWQIRRNGLKVQILLKLEGGHHGTHFRYQTAVVQTEAEQQFLGRCTGGLDPVGTVNNDASRFVNHQGGPGTVHGLDDHAAVALTTQFVDHTVMVKGSGANEANELILNSNVDGTGGHVTPPPASWRGWSLMKSPQAWVVCSTP